MKRKITIVTSVLLAVIIVIALLVPLVLDAERYRPLIERRLGASLGRPVQIGQLRFSLLAGGISARDVAVGEDPNFGKQPFLSAKALNVSVEMWPLLLHRELRIDSIKVREPDVHLIERNARWNVASLGRTNTVAATPASNAEASAVQLQKLAIDNGRITVQSGNTIQTYTDVNLTAANVSPDAQIPLTATAKTPGGGTFKVEGTVGPLHETFPAQLTITLDHLDLFSSGYFGPNATLDGVADLKAAVRASGIGGRNSGRVHVEGNASVTKLRLVKSGTGARYPIGFNFASDYDLTSESGRLTRGELKFNKTLAHLTGGFDLGGASPAINMALAAASVPSSDLQDLLPPTGLALPGGAALQGGSASTTLTMTGPADHLTVTGPLRLTDVTLTGFDLGAKMKGIGQLAGINTGRDTKIQSLDARLKATPDVISLSDINMVVQGIGSLTGAGTVNTPDRRLNFQLVAHLSQGGGLLGNLLQSANVGQLSNVPFRVEGTANDPRFVPDVGAILNSGNQQTPASGQAQPKTPLGGLFQQLFKKKK